MERPTSALHLTRVALRVKPLNPGPHTKKNVAPHTEVGRGNVYYHHSLISIGTRPLRSPLLYYPASGRPRCTD
jgi:hypothetical protein